jgi:hypothetical protein
MADRKGSGTLNRVTAAIRCGTIVAAAALLIAGITIMIAPRLADAKPEYAGQTGKPCGACHEKPAGGGKLTPAGEKFKRDRKK